MRSNPFIEIWTDCLYPSSIILSPVSPGICSADPLIEQLCRRLPNITDSRQEFSLWTVRMATPQALGLAADADLRWRALVSLGSRPVRTCEVCQWLALLSSQPITPRLPPFVLPIARSGPASRHCSPPRIRHNYTAIVALPIVVLSWPFYRSFSPPSLVRRFFTDLSFVWPLSIANERYFSFNKTV